MVYVFLAEGFEEIEAISVIDILRRCQLSVQTVSISDNLLVCGAHGIPVVADSYLEEVDFDAACAFVLPGGLPGSDNLQACSDLEALLKQADKAGKIVAAVCAAPKILGAFGITEGRCATCYPGYEQELLGATAKADRVVCDGHVITSRGAGTAADFAFAIASALGANPEPVRKGMLYDI